MSRHAPRRSSFALVGALLLVATLAACSDDPQTPSAPTETAPAEATLSDDPTPVVVDGDVFGVSVQVSVGPLVVHDDDELAVLRVVAEATGAGNVTVQQAFANHSLTQDGVFDAVRLVDLDAGVVREAAYTADGVAVARSGKSDVIETRSKPAVGFVAYDAPSGPSTDVLLPQLGLVEDVPVVDVETAGSLTVPLSDLTDDAPAELKAPVAFLETYSSQEDATVRTRSTSKTVTLEIDSDVLFDVGSADLSSDADGALTDVADQLSEAASGELRVIGHTDDVGEEDDNQELSERRAQSVADRLTSLRILDQLEVKVEGRGESEPLSDETTDEARALNRRVTVELSGEATDVVKESVEQKLGDDGLPVADGPTVAGLGSAKVEHVDDLGDTMELTVSLVDVRRAGNYLLGELEVSNSGDESAYFVDVLSSVRDGRGNSGGAWSGANNVTLLDGSLRTYPVDYLAEPGLYLFDGRNSLVEPYLGSLDPGQASSAWVVWPDTGADTVVVDVPYGSTDVTAGSSPVRFVDVPVRD
ncbi:OmpA family protein [Cellulosimicrobium terreum]|nr:OmpA family protein [Cellulosimicrobium terreum]